MAGIPSTWEALEAAGYVWQNRSHCRGCGQEIEWWLTPAGRWMPVEVVQLAGGARMAHWGICPKADRFRRAKEKAEQKREEPKLSKKQAKKAKQRKPESGMLFKL